jgi:hypothetical protein
VTNLFFIFLRRLRVPGLVALMLGVMLVPAMSSTFVVCAHADGRTEIAVNPVAHSCCSSQAKPNARPGVAASHEGCCDDLSMDFGTQLSKAAEHDIKPVLIQASTIHSPLVATYFVPPQFAVLRIENSPAPPPPLALLKTIILQV